MNEVKQDAVGLENCNSAKKMKSCGKHPFVLETEIVMLLTTSALLTAIRGFSLGMLNVAEFLASKTCFPCWQQHHLMFIIIFVSTSSCVHVAHVAYSTASHYLNTLPHHAERHAAHHNCSLSLKLFLG
jgi:hypothetical protein